MPIVWSSLTCSISNSEREVDDVVPLIPAKCPVPEVKVPWPVDVLGVRDGRMVVLVWTPRGTARRVISMRKADEREKAKFASRLG